MSTPADPFTEKARRRCRKDFIERVAGRTGCPERMAHQVIAMFLAEIVAAWERGEQVSFDGFGLFRFRFRKARTRKAQDLPHASGGVRKIPAAVRETVYIKFRWSNNVKARVLNAFYKHRKSEATEEKNERIQATI